MTGPHNLKPERVVKAFERAGWIQRGQHGSHVKLTKEGNPNILSIPVNTLGKTIDLDEPVTLVERQAFLQLLIGERRRIMTKQAKEMEDYYRQEKIEYLETGEIIEY